MKSQNIFHAFVTSPVFSVFKNTLLKSIKFLFMMLIQSVNSVGNHGGLRLGRVWNKIMDSVFYFKVSFGKMIHRRLIRINSDGHSIIMFLSDAFPILK